MAVVMEGGSRWGKAHDAGRDLVLQSSNSSTKSEDSSKPSSSSTSGASTIIALGGSGSVRGSGGGGQSKKRGWGDDLHKAVQLMLGQVPERETVDFLGVSNACQQQEEFLELDPNLPLPVGWEKCLDLRTGAVHYLNRSTGEKTLVDPRQAVFAVVGATAVPTTPSYHDGEADRNSDSPGTPPRSAARNFFGSRSSSSPSPRERAIECSSPPLGGSGLFLGSSLSTACLTEQAEPAASAPAPAPPMPWALEHWAAAAKGFSERNPLPAATPASAPAPPAPADFRFRWRPARSPEGGATSPLEDLNCGDDMGSNLELKLSSSTCGVVKDQGTSMCTMQKVREALRRSDKMLVGAGQLRGSNNNKSWSSSRAPAPCQQRALLNLRSPASPSHSSSSASSSTPPSLQDLGGEARASPPPPKRFRSSSPPTSKSLLLPAPLTMHRVSSPNCISSSSNVSSPAHPSSTGYQDAGPCPCPASSTISPNLASLKLAELESGSPSQVLTLGSPAEAGGGVAAMALACCRSCLMYMILCKEEPTCPKCHSSVDVAFAPSGPCSSSVPPLKKAKVEVDV